jgi:ubiquinone/menaquinone biosynthesis C-methylase UbiE
MAGHMEIHALPAYPRPLGGIDDEFLREADGRQLRVFCDEFAPNYMKAETTSAGTRAYLREEESTLKRLVDAMLNRSSRIIRILDIGHGDGRYGRIFFGYNRVKIVGMDNAANMLREARKSSAADLVLGAAETLPFPSESFDLVTMPFGLISYVRQPQSVCEAYRVLKPGGYFFGSAYNRRGFNTIAGQFFKEASVAARIDARRDKMTVNGVELTCCTFTPLDLRDCLRKQGFEVLDVQSHLGLRSGFSPAVIKRLQAELTCMAPVAQDDYNTERMMDALEAAFCKLYDGGMYLSAVARKPRKKMRPARLRKAA